MKHPITKLVGAVILICALLFAYYQMVYSRINMKATRTLSSTCEARLESIIETKDSLDIGKEQRLDQNEANRNMKAKMSVDWHLDYARRMGEAIEADPALGTGETLAELNEAIGARYIMLFDGDGNERACSGRYSGFSLGTLPEDSTTDFRRLLLGVPELSHGPAVDERTGLNTRMVGASCRMPDGRYGALIIAFDPKSPMKPRRSTTRCIC